MKKDDQPVIILSTKIIRPLVLQLRNSGGIRSFGAWMYVTLLRVRGFLFAVLAKRVSGRFREQAGLQDFLGDCS